MDPLNPLPPASESEPKDVIKVENLIEHKDETVPASVHEVGESSTTPFLREDSDGLLPGLMRRDINSLFVRSSVEQGTAVMEKLVEKLGNTEDKAECKKLKKIMPPKSAPLTQAAIRRMIKESVEVAIVAEQARHANAGNEARGSGPVRGQDAAPAVCESTFTGFMKCNPTTFHEGKKVKFASATLFNELALMCLRMVEPKSVKVDAYILGLTNKIKGEVTSSKPVSLNEAMRMDNSRQTLQNNQKQGNERAMVTAPTNGKVSFGSLLLCERCFTRHVGLCTIKCHKCRKIGYNARYCKEKNVATGVNALPIPTCYGYGEQGHTRNRCLRKFKQEEVREVHGRAYAIKDVEPKGPNVVTVNHIFEIDLMPIELGTFDIIIGMDWLVKHNAVIICGEKVVRIPYGDKMLIVESDKGVSRLKVISCIKAHVLVIRDFPEVFLEELPGLPPLRQVEFRIDLVPRVAPVARAPCRLASSEMRELSVQLQELLEKGFIHPSSSAWGAPV
ncbi:putative reverse transcriptase domain-containing protein [Tanacetum coccineum]